MLPAPFPLLTVRSPGATFGQFHLPGCDGDDVGNLLGGMGRAERGQELRIELFLEPSVTAAAENPDTGFVVDLLMFHFSRSWGGGSRTRAQGKGWSAPGNFRTHPS